MEFEAEIEYVVKQGGLWESPMDVRREHRMLRGELKALAALPVLINVVTQGGDVLKEVETTIDAPRLRCVVFFADEDLDDIPTSLFSRPYFDRSLDQDPAWCACSLATEILRDENLEFRKLVEGCFLLEKPVLLEIIRKAEGAPA